jgi:aminoglycoside 3-N-acetyltransferase
VVEALFDALGPGPGPEPEGTQGTLVVPTHTPENSDPAAWGNPPVPESWWPVIREQTPAFDPRRTPPSRWMGIIAETVRAWPGALRSDHPQVSFAALGPRAGEIVGEHPLDEGLGDRSPLGAVYGLGGKVLLLGCGHDSNTSLHLAEWRQAAPPRAAKGASVRQPDGTARWATWVDMTEDEHDFEEVGAAFEAASEVSASAASTPAPVSTPTSVSIGPIGNATARLMSQPALVDFAAAWFAANRR